MSEDMNETQAKDRFFHTPQLKLVPAIMIAITLAAVIVTIAYLMYWNDPNRKYDLARGGDAVNQALSVEDSEADTTSAVSAQATKQKIEYLDKELRALTSINAFHPDDLNGQNIQLLPAEQPSL